MQFDSFSSFIHMGGHGPYVWACYALTLAVVAFNLVEPLWRNKRIRRELQQWRRRQQP